jgi:hypothetical protein
MADAAPVVKKKGAPKGQKQRVLTFVVAIGNEVKLVKVRTVASSLEDAWKELNMPEGAKFFGAIKGSHEFMTEKVLRKLTYAELMKKAGLA